MKIISIKFLNLNSLKGQHEIRFDRPPFTESGIFAITGPTGAGKTTLLDAITVALYGKVHRHSKDVFEIMTRHTAESYAEVEFEVRDKLYRAKWSIRRSRGKADGALQTQKMELADAVTGQIIIEHPLNEVRDEIVRLCGLDYNQFLRSVILSQGDFTRFLKADENERSELLEKITDTGIYSQISIAAYEKAREERAKLDQLKGRLDHVILLTIEERLAYTTQLNELSDQEIKLKKEEASLRVQLDWLGNLEKLEAKKQDLLHQLSEAELFHAAHEPRFIQLQQHLKALVYRPALAELNVMEEQQQRIEVDLKEVKLLYPDFLKEEERTKNELAAAKEQASLKEKNLTALEPIFEEVSKKDILIVQAANQQERTGHLVDAASLQLRNLTAGHLAMTGELQTTQQRIDLLTEWLKRHSEDATLDNEVIIFRQLVQQLTALEGKISTSRKEQKEHAGQKDQADHAVQEASKNITLTEQQLLETHQAIQQLKISLQAVLGGKTDNDLEEELRELPVLINTSEQQFRLAGTYLRLEQERITLISSQAQYSKELTEAKILLNTLLLEQEQGAVLLDQLQQIYELEVKVQKYEGDRLQLHAEEPCPLCGSVHHPFVEGNYVTRLTEAEERRNQQQVKLQLLKTKYDAQLVIVNSLSYQLQTLESSLLLSKDSLDQTLLEFTANNDKLPKPLDVNRPEIIGAVINKKKQQQDALTGQLKSARDMQFQVNQLEAKVVQQNEQLATERNKAAQAGLMSTFEAKQIAAALQEEQAGVKESEAVQLQAAQLLQPLNISFSPGDIDVIILEMSNRYSRYQQSAQELNLLQPDLRQKETELKNTGLAIEEKKEAIAQLTAQLKEEQRILQQLQEERIALFGSKDPAEERLQLSDDFKKYRAQMESLQLSLQEKQEKVRILEDRQSTLNTSFLKTKELFSAHLEKLTEKISADGLSSITALQQLYLPDEEATIAEELQKEAARRVTSGKSLLIATEKELAAEIEKSLSAETKEVLFPLLEEQGQAISLLQQEKGKLNRVISEDDQLKLKHMEVAQEIERQQQEFDRFQQLSALIGSADGKKFSRFAQGLTLARLTELANRHLLRLSDRYSILKSPERDLDLQIIDGYQADVVRPMSTLSGGESFLVSLALALGLSDLASRKVQINSLFIDEGFGTLDAETLDVAITALENLQAGGKNIGIISHVEALKERIGTQIQLSRQPGGTSKIMLYNYGTLIES